LLLTWKRYRGKGIWVILLYLCYSVVTELINTYYNIVYHDTSYLNFNVFDIVEYCLLSWFAYILIRSKRLRYIILGLSSVFLVIAISRIFKPVFSTQVDSLTNVLESILLIIYSIFYLFEQIRKPDHIFFYSIPEFWFIVAILLYFSGTFFINLYAQGKLESDESFQLQYSVINTAFDILKNLLFGVAMMVKGGDQSNKISRIDFNNLDEHLNLNR